MLTLSSRRSKVELFYSVTLFYSFKKINQYEDLILQFQRIINISTEKMKTIDASGTFESDDEVGFFFNQLKDLQLVLDSIFEE